MYSNVIQIIMIRSLSAKIVFQFHAKYKFKSRSDNAPHIFAVADQAYQDMLHHKETQHILLAGETRSGKTTNMLHLLQHLLYLGQVTAHCRLR
jgi:myosin heavy subunit